MKDIKIFSIGLCLFVLFIYACDNEGGKSNQDKITTDLINNPNTASSDKDKVDKKVSKITFDDVLYEFGKISQGEEVHHKFHFTNTGDATLIISDARGSCGCTVPTWPKEPIRPGDTASVSVVFNSNGRMGKQHKTVTVVANTQPNTTVIALSGYVLVSGQKPEDVE